VLDILMFIVFALTQGDFATKQNIENVFTSSATIWIIALGMTFAVLTGGFDLSVGASVSFIGVLMAKLLGLGIPGGLVLVLMILAGTAIGGILNGLFIGVGRLSMFLVTLASMSVLTGIVALWSNSQSFFVIAPIGAQLGTDNLAGIPVPIWIMVAALLLALYVQHRTYFGRDVYAVGDSTPAARLAGIPVARTVVIVYAVTGACAALAGGIEVGQVGSATPQVDPTIALNAIAAVLLGGTAMTGGSGGVGGTVLGVLFIGMLQNGLNLYGVSTDWQQVGTGVILVGAVLADRLDRDNARAAWTRVRGGFSRSEWRRVNPSQQSG
jgi:ribose/xylose/arabinose/galactoside ABC-type transport system permease subunit